MNNEDWCKENCPYNTDCSCDGVCNFVLSLLKEQIKNRDESLEKAREEIKWLRGMREPVLLENQHKPYGNLHNANAPWISRCPKCGKKIEGKLTRFCKYCGKAVKWDEK